MGLGALVGSTPILGVHTWLSVLLAGLLRLPPAAALVGSNVSNPLTFIPITLLEIRVGSWILGRRLPPLDGSWSWERLGPYLGAAWVGTIPVGLGLAVVCSAVVFTLLRNRRERVEPSGAGPEEGNRSVSGKESGPK